MLPSASTSAARILFLFCLLISLCISAARPSYSINLYYVELGRFNHEAELSNRWQELVDEQTALLGDLTPYPRRIIHEGRRNEMHLYAGPLEGKEDASKLCSRLFKADIPCFVVEGLPVISARVARVDKDPVILPWLAEKALQEQQEAEQQAMLPWVVASHENNEDAAESAPIAAAKMQVAEAVRVPLSESHRVFWIEVPPAEANANLFENWAQLMRDHADLLSHLTLEPPSQDNTSPTLRLGEFSTEAEAVELCYRLKQRGVFCSAAGGL
ncbi:MAG: SPOR domain-containing protein [Alphaproteobacteria bacterium]|nr:SPOR domain-containing protein [Alphaproteobacteria bacterium]